MCNDGVQSIKYFNALFQQEIRAFSCKGKNNWVICLVLTFSLDAHLGVETRDEVLIQQCNMWEWTLVHLQVKLPYYSSVGRDSLLFPSSDSGYCIVTMR